jgi:hypothetical protein
MNAALLAAQAVADLQPLLAAKGVLVKSPVVRRKKGGRRSPGNDFWVSVSPDSEVAFGRSLPLTIWEAAILGPYGNALAELSGVPAGVARTAADDVIVRAIAGQLGGRAAQTVEESIRFLIRTAGRTYEGQARSCNLLLDLADAGHDAVIANLRALEAHEWHALLGTGVHTGLLVEAGGAVSGVIPVPPPPAASPEDDLAPVALEALGHWTTHGAANTRIAMSLTRNREIAIQQSGVLRYVFRSGRWKALPFEVALRTGWSSGAWVRKRLKRAMLAAAIDSSFRHHGACVSVVTRGHRKTFDAAGVVVPSDRWPENVRAKLFPATKFQQLNRWQKLELLSMDGATVLGHEGDILAAGAIVKVPAGSTGGGRLAAALELAKFGAAIKVSQDGPITAFGLGGTGDVVPIFDLA